MKQNQHSLTSLVSAFGRAYHSKYDSPKIIDDYLAEKLITEDEFKEISHNLVQGIHFFNQEIGHKYQHDSDEILKWVTQVQLSPIPLARQAFCERVLKNEIELGLKQYVILGAGLDTFSFRHPELSHRLEIFEVDHPDTQKFKLERLAFAQLEIPPHLQFIPMDFSKPFSNHTFKQNGIKENKTLFSLLGVSYYVTKEEFTHLLDHIFSIVPSGSSIVFDYPDETLFSENGFSNRVKNMLKMAEVSGEPMKSSFSYEEMELILENLGLLIYEHLTTKEINDEFFTGRTDYLNAFETVRFLHAVKR